MKKRIALLVCALLVYAVAWSCSCLGNESFCNSITWEYKPDILILGKKVRTIDHGMQVEVLEVFQGKGIAVGDVLMVWGDNGIQCRVYVSNFELGEKVIFGLHQLKNPWPGVEQEKAGDYELSICGVYYYSLTNGHPFAPETLEEIGACIEKTTGVSISIPNRNEGLTVMPNPMSSSFSVGLNEFWKAQTIQVELYNTLGQQVWVKTYKPDQQLTIETNQLPAGVYYLRLRKQAKLEEKAVLKFVKT